MSVKESGAGLSAALGFVVFSFAANSVITRFMVASELVSPFVLTVIRFGSGLGMLVALHLALPKAFPRVPLRQANLIGGLLLASYGFSISFGYLFIGAAAGTFVFFAAVVLSMALLGVAVEHERLGPRELIGLALAVAGVFTLTYGGVALVTGVGVVLMIVTGVSWGAYSVFGRRFTEDFSYTLYSFAILTVVALPALLLTSPVDLLEVPVSLEGWGLALYFGTISTALSYVVWHWALNRITASQGGVYQMVIPVIAAVMGIAFLSEEPSLSLVAGGGLIILGIYLNRRTAPSE
ncbi:MAG: DMT family transporter [Thermoplasmata archaeon]